MGISLHKNIDCTDLIRTLWITFQCSASRDSHTLSKWYQPVLVETHRGDLESFQESFFILYTKMYHTLDSNLKKWGVISQQKWSFEITFTNSNFALSFQYCIVQQASSTAKATLTPWLMSGKTVLFFFFNWKSLKHTFVLYTSKYKRLLLLVISVVTVAFPFLQLQWLHPTVHCQRASSSKSHVLFCII